MGTPSVVLLDDNKRHRKYTGVSKFHAAGYYGAGIVAASGEAWSLKSYNPDDQCVDPFGEGFGTGHSLNTAATFFQVAPKAQLYMLSTSSLLSGTPGRSYDKFVTKSIPLIKEKRITAMFNSFTKQYNNETREAITNSLKEVEDFFKCFFAMGNDSTKDYNQITDIEEIFGVSAYTLMVSGEAVPAGYSSESETTDFAAPSMIYTNTTATKPSDSGGPNAGTSFSAPWLCGMCCLLDEFFIDKTGKPLTREMTYRFFKDHTKDLGNPGFDKKNGYGAVILPDPSEIDVEKYQPTGGDTPMVDPDDKGDENPNMPDMSAYKEFKTYTPKTGVSVNVIPHDSIDRLDFVQCKQPLETLGSFYKRQENKPQILINGGLFNWSNGGNIMSFVDEGEEKNWQNGFEGIGTLPTDPSSLIYGFDNGNTWKDFMSAYPMLVKKGDVVSDYGKAAELNYKTARQAIGFTENKDLIILTVDQKSGGMQFADMAKLFLKYDAYYAMNLDGGGSVRKLIGGEVANTPTEDRAVDNVFCVYLKEVSDDVDNNKPVIGNSYYALQELPAYVGIESDNIEMTIPKGAQFKVNNVTEWNGKIWMAVEYDYQRGFSIFTEETVGTVAPKDEEPVTPPVEPDPEPEAPEFVAGVYRVNVVDGTYLSVRNAPAQSGDLVDKLYRGDEIVITEIKNEIWGKLKSDAEKYVNINYTIRVKDYEDPVVVIPTTGKIAAVIADAFPYKTGDIVYVVEENGDTVVCQSNLCTEASTYTIAADAVSYIITIHEDETVVNPDDNKTDDVLDQFQDKDEIPAYAVDSVRRMVEKGVFNSDKKFRPNDTATRAELAVIADRLVNSLK
nr:MAG TPA: Phosphodiester glycosidase [Caudoviricetes sp.]